MYSCKVSWCDTCKKHFYDGVKDDSKHFHYKEKTEKDFPKPKSILQEILLHLITKKEISLFDFNIPGYRTRLSNLQLQNGLFLERRIETKYSKYGNAYRYAIHSLPENQKEKAIQIYINLNNQKK